MGKTVMVKRYIVRNGSKSGHCCFDFTVMDTTKPEIIGGKHYETNGKKQYEAVCECFEQEQAELVAAALNQKET